MDWSDNFLTTDIRNYNAVDQNGKKLFTIQETLIFKNNDMIHTHKLITNSGEELSFDEYNQITGKNLEYIKGMLYPVRFNKYIMLLISSEINIRLWKKKTGEMNFLIIILKLK